MSKKIWDSMPGLKEVLDGVVAPSLFIGPVKQELTEAHQKIINEMEEEFKKTKLKVVAVIDGNYDLGGDIVNMVAYVYVDSQSKPWLISNGGKEFGFMARVINKDWDVDEYGSVGITALPNGAILRTH